MTAAAAAAANKAGAGKAVAATAAALFGSAAALLAAFDRMAERRYDAVPVLPHGDAPPVQRRMLRREHSSTIPNHDMVVYEERVAPPTHRQSCDGQLQRSSEIAHRSWGGSFFSLGSALRWRMSSGTTTPGNNNNSQLPKVEVYRTVVLEPVPSSSRAIPASSASPTNDLLASDSWAEAASSMLSGSTDQTLVKCLDAADVPAGTASSCIADPRVLGPIYMRTMLGSVREAALGLDAAALLKGPSPPAAAATPPPTNNTVGSRPLRIAMLGAGGCALPWFLNRALPDAHIDVVDVEPRMFAVAREDFGIPDSPPSMNYIAAEAGTFVEQQRASAVAPYDCVLVDLFIGNRVPSRFKSADFLQSVQRLLQRSDANAGANVCFNLPASDPGFEAVCRTVFPEVIATRVPRCSNVVVTCRVAAGAASSTYRETRGEGRWNSQLQAFSPYSWSAHTSAGR